MGQSFLFTVFPYSADMGKEATTSQVEYMACRREKIYLMQIFYIYTRHLIYSQARLILHVIRTCRKDAEWTLTCFTKTGKCQFYRKTDLDSESMQIRIKQNSPYSKHILNFPEGSGFVSILLQYFRK